MPRTERPLDSTDTELGAFATGLRELRDRAGTPSYRVLASRAHYSAATLSDAAGGKKLPSLAVTLAYVTACGGDPDEWEQRWRDIAAPPHPAGEAPYVGLEAFREEDADRFFGRERLTARLRELVGERAFVGVFGASGSGKSSLLRAGLLPHLDRALVLTPGVRPQDECAVRLAQATGDSPVVLHSELTDPAALGLFARRHELALVVDQFEEVFTLCGAEQRDWFVRALVQAPRVVIGVRADFYGHVGRHPELVEALDGAQLLVGPLTTDELRRAIVEPARRVGATVESALVTRLVADVAGQAAALPLVQHVLVETWHRRRGMTLSLTGYEEAGGVEHAIAHTAETVHDQLTDEQRQTARRIFLRLIALGEGTEDTKRRALRDDLDAEVLDRLANARLVTLTEQHAELTHEALIRSWPRLRDWIAEDREALRAHHRLTEAAAQWDGDRDLLYQGARLAQAAELDPASLTGPEREFLAASQAAGRRRVRQVRSVVAVLSVLVVLLAGTVVFAAVKAGEAARGRDAAIAGAAAAQARILMHQQSAMAKPVALAAYRVAPGDATRDLLLSTDAGARRTVLWFRPDAAVGFTEVNGRTALHGGSSSAPGFRLFDVETESPGPIGMLPAKPSALSADGRRAVVSAGDGVELVDLSDLARPRLLAKAPLALRNSIFTSGTGDVLAGVRDDGAGEGRPVVLRYDGTERLSEVPRRDVGPAAQLRLSRDGSTLAVLRTGTSTLEIASTTDGELRHVSEFNLHNSFTTPLGFSPDGRLLVLADSLNAQVEVWDVVDRAHPARRFVLRAPAAEISQVQFTPDSRRLAVGAERSVRVWDLAGEDAGHPIATFENFSFRISALGHQGRADDFLGLDGSTVFRMRTDVGKVIAEICAGPDAVLSDQDWAKYFPGLDRVPVC
ncbi:hypothetical protein [Lentzea sp. NPDC059081]|uniref:nSTAND1 domain-containing NTPase n=1 Tax=Lentzea sp. NPDC059081 TaxID=3346719 RepID=UPI00368D61BB